jgi:hypothetical protein
VLEGDLGLVVSGTLHRLENLSCLVKEQMRRFLEDDGLHACYSAHLGPDVEDKYVSALHGC